MKKVLLVLLIFIMSTSCINVFAETYSDVGADSEYRKAVDVLSAMGVMEGYGDLTFKPEEPLTRAEAAAIMVRLLDLTDDARQNDVVFTDVESTHWAFKYIKIAAKNGIVNGMGDGTFEPNRLVTYGEMVKMAVNATCWESFAIAQGGWNEGCYIAAGKEAGIIKDESISSDENITRGEAAELIYNALTVGFMEHWC